MAIDIIRFISENCVFSKYVSVRAKTLYEAYLVYCRKNKQYRLKTRQFYKAVADQGFEKRKSTGNHTFFYGLDLKQEEF